MIVDRGDLLKEVVKSSGISISTIVKRVGISRTTYYNHIMDKNLPSEILDRYGRVLGYDFSKVDSTKSNVLRSPTSLQEAFAQINIWKERYYTLLEKYNTIIEEQLDKKNK